MSLADLAKILEEATHKAKEIEECEQKLELARFATCQDKKKSNDTLDEDNAEKYESATSHKIFIIRINLS